MIKITKINTPLGEMIAGATCDGLCLLEFSDRRMTLSGQEDLTKLLNTDIRKGHHKYLRQVKKEIKEYFGVRHCFLVSSGKAALTLILQALHDMYPERDKVLLPAFTCYSVPSAIVRAGLKMRLCDLEPRTMGFDLECFRGALANCNDSPNSKSERGKHLLAVVAAHLYGFAGCLSSLQDLIREAKIVLIEDAAQVMGGEWKRRKLGTLGDVGFFSLGRGKALSTTEGGVLITNRGDLAETIERRFRALPSYRNIELLSLFIRTFALFFFLKPGLFWVAKSIPSLQLGETIYDPHFKIRKMSSFQAGLARGWAKKLEEFWQKRAENSQKWISILEKRQGIQLFASKEFLPNMIRFPVKIEDKEKRERILAAGNQYGLGIMPSYPDSINGIRAIKDLFSGTEYPIAKEFSKKIITLPNHPLITQDDIRKVIGLLDTFVVQ